MNYEKLKKYVDQGLSTRKIANIENMSQTGIRYWLHKHNLKTRYGEHKTPWRKRKEKHCKFCGELIVNINTYCNGTCKANYDAMLFGKKWQVKGQNVLPKSVKRHGLIQGTARRYLFLINNFSCARCNWTYDFGDSSFPPLEVSHKDNDYKNNNLANLELLCPNCHAVQTRLYPVKKGNGRWSNGDDSRNNLVI